jgi:hypothetical protein
MSALSVVKGKRLTAEIAEKESRIPGGLGALGGE